MIAGGIAYPRNSCSCSIDIRAGHCIIVSERMLKLPWKNSFNLLNFSICSDRVTYTDSE